MLRTGTVTWTVSLSCDWRATIHWWWDGGHGWGPHVNHWLGTGFGTYFL